MTDQPTPIEPDLFWDDADPESAGDSVADIVDRYANGEIVCIRRAVRLHDVFAVRVETATGYDTEQFDTVEEAEAWVEEKTKEGNIRVERVPFILPDETQCRVLGGIHRYVDGVCKWCDAQGPEVTNDV